MGVNLDFGGPEIITPKWVIGMSRPAPIESVHVGILEVRTTEWSILARAHWLDFVTVP